MTISAALDPIQPSNAPGSASFTGECRANSRNIWRLSLVGILGCGLMGCGGAQPDVQAPVAPEFQQPVELYSASTVPDHCADGSSANSSAADSDECLPPLPWVEKLCSGVHADVALQMFRGGSRWQRLYSRAIAPAFNGAGGPSLSEEDIGMNEELIALQRNGASGAQDIEIGDTTGYNLLRWNGSCVTLHDGEFSTRTPRRTTHSRVEWRWLGTDVRSALRDDNAIHDAYLARRKECRGSAMGSVTKACQELDSSLVDAIVDYVREGGHVVPHSIAPLRVSLSTVR